MCWAFLSATITLSSAADFEPAVVAGANHVRHGWRWNWRDRCALAGYYCLYAWRGYVWSYRWDDNPFYPGRYRHK
jgi:hypothetical protein